MTTDLSQLAHTIAEAHEHFSRLAARQVNTAFTLRNWLIGFYIVGYEQQGADRAQYGERVLKELASRRKAVRLKGMSDTNLKLLRQFYQTYPRIGQAVPDQLPKALPVPPLGAPAPGDPGISPTLLLNRLSLVGIILCARKDDALVQYATGGLPQTVFVSKYLVNLPSEEDLRQLVRQEQEKLGH